MALEMCPTAIVVATWFMAERMAADIPIDPRRMRWLGPDENLDLGDRTLHFVRPPLYDSPTTRVVYDSASKILWAADLFAVPVEQPTNDAEELSPEALEEGFLAFQQWNSPWVELLDRAKFQAQVDRLAQLDIQTIASTHGPAFTGGQVKTAFDLLSAVPDGPVIPQPSQVELDAIIAQIASLNPA